MPSTFASEPLEGLRVGVFSPGIRRIPHLQAFLGASRVIFLPGPARRVDAVVGWGRKPTGRRARRYAGRQGIPFVALEDGFLRSLDLGVHGEAPMSLVVDDRGIYYDSREPSRLESLITSSNLSSDDRGDVRRTMERLREARLSKYNASPEIDLGPRRADRVLVVDQTAGDLSLRYGGCDERTFEDMLTAALDENPGADVWVKTHPDVLARRREGLARRAERPRLRWLDRPAHPAALFDQIDRVYVMTSLMGFEALIWGKPVTCFGAPFYAGWGVTDDRGPVPTRRQARRSIEEIFDAAYLRYARYVDPETGRRCTIDRVVEDLALRRRRAELDRGAITGVGFSAWKRRIVPRFVGGPGTALRFVGDVDSTTDGERLLVWGSREVPEGREVWRMEDGFLRSVGLGSDLYSPSSLVVDRRGIYYDPSVPSELEHLLENADVSETELERAQHLRQVIVERGLSKYNLLGSRRRVGVGEQGRRVALVIGQVEDDASIRLGTVDISRNEDLLRAVRLVRPNAHLVYKPHPDVVSGNRRDSLPLRLAKVLCDEVVTDGTLADCLAAAQEVHTMTSLVGFEALLRGLSVHVYGLPFYAGWGLTSDRHAHPRRTRRRTLDELVALTLIRYPRYASAVTGRPTTPEVVVAQLASARMATGGGRPGRAWTKLWNLLREVSGAP